MTLMTGLSPAACSPADFFPSTVSEHAVIAPRAVDTFAAAPFAADEPLVNGKNEWVRAHIYGKSYQGPWLSDTFVVNRQNGEIYNSDSLETVRQKSAMLLVGNTFVNFPCMLATLVSSPVMAAMDVGTTGWTAGATRLLQGVLAPVSWVGLYIGALYGVMRPYEGRAMYAAIGDNLLFDCAPCFHPVGNARNVDVKRLQTLDETQHLLGGQRIGSDRW